MLSCTKEAGSSALGGWVVSKAASNSPSPLPSPALQKLPLLQVRVCNIFAPPPNKKKRFKAFTPQRRFKIPKKGWMDLNSLSTGKQGGQELQRVFSDSEPCCRLRSPKQLLEITGGSAIENLQCRFNAWVKEILWRRKWQPTLGFLPGKSHGRKSPVGYSPWGRKELDTT